jgi:hypothetical protein
VKGGLSCVRWAVVLRECVWRDTPAGRSLCPSGHFQRHHLKGFRREK